VQFSPELREAVASGDITVSIRLWSRPKVKVGGRYPTAGVTIEIDAIELLPFSAVGADDVRCSGECDRESLRLRAAHAGPITDDTLVYRIEFHVAEP
jgi:ASCH domain-containing protein